MMKNIVHRPKNDSCNRKYDTISPSRTSAEVRSKEKNEIRREAARFDSTLAQGHLIG